MKLRTVLLVITLVSYLSMFATSTSINRYVPTCSTASLTDSSNVKLSLHSNNMPSTMLSKLVVALPEILESVGLSEKEINASLKQLSKSLSSKIKVLNRYAKKKDLSSDEVLVKKMLSDMGFRIGESDFDTRKLSPDFVAAFTTDNVKELQNTLNEQKQYYDNVRKMKGMQAKLESMTDFEQKVKQMTDVKLLKAASKEYGSWIGEMMGAGSSESSTIDIATTGPTSKADEAADMVRKSKQDSIEKANNKRNAEIFEKAYVLKREQIKISNMPYTGSNKTKLVGITRAEKETRVTVAVPIHFDGNWINTDSTFYMIDLQTNDRYYPRRLENDIPLNRVIIVNKFAKTMLELTYVYPALKKSVVKVDIVESPESNVEIPSNSSGRVELRNVRVDAVKTSGQVFR